MRGFRPANGKILSAIAFANHSFSISRISSVISMLQDGSFSNNSERFPIAAITSLSLSLSALSIIVYSSVLGNASIVCIDRRRICSLVNKYKMIIYYQARINNHRYQSVPVYAKLTHSSLQSLYHSLHFLNKI